MSMKTFIFCLGLLCLNSIASAQSLPRGFKNTDTQSQIGAELQKGSMSQTITAPSQLNKKTELGIDIRIDLLEKKLSLLEKRILELEKGQQK